MFKLMLREFPVEISPLVTAFGEEFYLHFIFDSKLDIVQMNGLVEIVYEAFREALEREYILNIDDPVEFDWRDNNRQLKFYVCTGGNTFDLSPYIDRLITMVEDQIYRIQRVNITAE